MIEPDEHVLEQFHRVFEQDPDPKTYEEFYADEAQFDALKDCPRCGEPQGWTYCSVCHGQR